MLTINNGTGNILMIESVADADDSVRFDSGGGVRIASGGTDMVTVNNTSATFAGNALFSGSGVVRALKMTTSAGSDDSGIVLAGGGDDADTRGAFVQAMGNEKTSVGGRMYIASGNISTGHMHFVTGGSDTLKLDYDKSATFAGDVLINDDLTVGRGTKSDSVGSGYCIKWGGDSGGSDRWGFRVKTSTYNENLCLDANLAGTPHQVLEIDKLNGNATFAGQVTLTSPILNNDRGSKANQNFSLGSDVVQSGLVLYFNASDSNCYGTSGTAVNDLSSGNNDGVMGSLVSYSSDDGGCWDFQGGGNSRAYIGTALTYPTTDEITLCMWIKYENNTQVTHQLNGIQSSGGYCYIGRSPDATRHIYSYIGAGTEIVNTNTPLTPGKWHHLAIGNSNGTGAYGMGFAYLDGHLVELKQTANVTAHSNVFCFGGVNGNSDVSIDSSYTLDGRIASVQIYDRALCHSEILHSMNVDLPRLLH
jgi:hypothetical protein